MPFTEQRKAAEIAWALMKKLAVAAKIDCDKMKPFPVPAALREAQGYRCSKPVSPEEILLLLRAGGL
ncbi:hypothetical protein [Rhizobium leguminosarum]|uniref:hypothetical protein n=1 Tax=Rhizobium leguminosarum TaxID=384 RepID=UPI00142E2A5A|nr:hypothetical protein [Rhizobium leguminosarum]